MESEPVRFIEVQLANVGIIATIYLGLGGESRISACRGEYEQYKEDLRRILEEIGGTRLSMPAESSVDASENGRITIYDKDHYCSPGEADALICRRSTIEIGCGRPRDFRL